MLGKLNYTLFHLLNARPDSSLWIINFVKFIAMDLINIIPMLIIILWMRGSHKQLQFQRQLVIRVLLALGISMIISWILRYLFPCDRPFVKNIGCNFLHYTADNSFPSNHGTIAFTFALSFLLWHKTWSGILLMILAFTISWSRIYLGIHWPLDIFGSLLVAIIGSIITWFLWNIFGQLLYLRLQQVYRICFALAIRKGWIKD